MFVLCLVYICISIVGVSEGRTVQAMTGSDVSFSFNLTNVTNDIHILHEKSLFISVWPEKSFVPVHKEPDKVRVVLNVSSGERIIVMISLLNITKKNAGIYSVTQASESETITDSLLLQVIEGKTVQAVIGRNVSFSFTLSNLTTDTFFILHDTSLFSSVWPSKSVCIQHEDPENTRVSVYKSSGKTTTVTVILLNITKKHDGIYTAAEQSNLEYVMDGIFLKTIDDSMIPRIVIVHHLDLDLSLVLQCLTNSSNSGYILWKLNTSHIENFTRYSQNNAYLSISNLTAEDQYNSYTCSEQESGLESDPYRIKAFGPTFINFTPKNIEVSERESVNVSCISDCTPVCTTKWTKRDRVSGTETDISAIPMLYITNITRQDAGAYRCRVQNVISDTAYTNVLALDVVYGPDEILMNASDTFIEVDELKPISISCSSNCFPPCHIQWSHSNKPLYGEDLWSNNLPQGGNFTCHAVNVKNVNASISRTISITLKSGTGFYTITTMEVNSDATATELRINRFLLYLVIVMGIFIFTGIGVCVLRKFVKCPCLARIPDSVQFQDIGEVYPLQGNSSEGYWTIISNAEGNLSTQLETNTSHINDQTPFSDKTVEVITWDASPQFPRTDGYIHAIHSDPVNTGLMTAYDKTDT
ncbi:hypothetical protein ACJMK2_027048 [Sinanodonta woodiana]|uniref:Ig-like domain-containing protein n=1 Tax=Sinanodonta woodiana TaxID=1069815 RepID=A0ABD3XPV5_SINWO